MILNEILLAGSIVFSFLIVINAWLLIGFMFIILFQNFEHEIEYKEIVLICFTFPLALMLMLSKHIHTKELENDNGEQ